MTSQKKKSFKQMIQLALKNDTIGFKQTSV
jgi:hypothetical protein